MPISELALTGLGLPFLWALLLLKKPLLVVQTACLICIFSGLYSGGYNIMQGRQVILT